VGSRWIIGTVAITSFALWSIAPTSWIQFVRNAEMLPFTRESHTVQAERLALADSFPPDITVDNGSASGSSCEPTSTPTPLPAPTSPPSPVALATPVAEDNVPPTPSAVAQSALQATFRLCGSPDPNTQRSIEQLIAGRGFSARLASRSDGCADLSITVSPSSSRVSSGRQSTSLSISSGSGGSAHPISIQIVSQNGATHVAIGPGN
jgi:hypothetical protein